MFKIDKKRAVFETMAGWKECKEMAVLRDRVFKSQHFNSFQLPDQQLYFDSLVEGFSIFSGLRTSNLEKKSIFRI